MFHQNTTLRANPKIFQKQKQINYFPIARQGSTTIGKMK
jgi:hypothetical protein